MLDIISYLTIRQEKDNVVIYKKKVMIRSSKSRFQLQRVIGWWKITWEALNSSMNSKVELK